MIINVKAIIMKEVVKRTRRSTPRKKPLDLKSSNKFMKNPAMAKKLEKVKNIDEDVQCKWLNIIGQIKTRLING